MNIYKDLYKEIATMISEGIEAVEWVDLWHEQVNFLADEHPFPTPAVFLSFRTNVADDIAEKVQVLSVQIDVYLFYETFTDTYSGGINEDDALAFTETLTEIFKLLHATNGDYYSNMRRISGTRPVSTGGAGNLYVTPFEATVRDASALIEYDELGDDVDINSTPGNNGPWQPFEITL